MEKRGTEDVIHRRHPDHTRDKSKSRTGHESPHRKSEVYRPRSDESMRKIEGFSESLKARKQHESCVQFEDIELEAKETQTKEKREEKGLQISLGRHVTRPSPILAVAGSQTEKPAFCQKIFDKMKHGYSLPILYFLGTFTVIFLSFLVVKAAWPPPVEEPPLPRPGFMKRLATSVGWFFHVFSHCSAHRRTLQ